VPDSLRAALRFDGSFWRRLAELGCVDGPEWRKCLSPPAIAAVIFAIARAQRGAVLRNQRQVRGPSGWEQERWNTYRVFAEFARSLGRRHGAVGAAAAARADERRPRGLRDGARRAAWPRRGEGPLRLVEIGTRGLLGFGHPVNMVTAHEPNPSVRALVHGWRTRHGANVIYSDRSLFTGLPIVQAPPGLLVAAALELHDRRDLERAAAQHRGS
jgi:hypothetical protein